MDTSNTALLHESDTETASSPVFRPAHYSNFTIEPFTFIAANKLPFLVGCVVKYVCRHEFKNGDEELKKAKRCIEMLIEARERERQVKEGRDSSDVWGHTL